jgi:hypothetical protein
LRVRNSAWASYALSSADAFGSGSRAKKIHA